MWIRFELETNLKKNLNKCCNHLLNFLPNDMNLKTGSEKKNWMTEYFLKIALNYTPVCLSRLQST